VTLAIDADEISCGGTTTGGASSGFRLPAAGLLPAAHLAPVIAALLEGIGIGELGPASRSMDRPFRVS
jgi:hypothetical protein